MTDVKNEQVFTINLNIGVTENQVNLAKAYLDAGAVDKEVVQQALSAVDKYLQVFAQALAGKLNQK